MLLLGEDRVFSITAAPIGPIVWHILQESCRLLLVTRGSYSARMKLWLGPEGHGELVKAERHKGETNERTSNPDSSKSF
jgi:hypothetical protein